MAYEFHEASPGANHAVADFRTAATKKAGRPAVKFFQCSLYSENGLAWPWEAGSGKYDAQPSVSKSARPGTLESELAD